MFNKTNFMQFAASDTNNKTINFLDKAATLFALK
jgi:hypothetical protein